MRLVSQYQREFLPSVLFDVAFFRISWFLHIYSIAVVCSFSSHRVSLTSVACWDVAWMRPVVTWEREVRCWFSSSRHPLCDYREEPIQDPSPRVKQLTFLSPCKGCNCGFKVLYRFHKISSSSCNPFDFSWRCMMGPRTPSSRVMCSGLIFDLPMSQVLRSFSVFSRWMREISVTTIHSESVNVPRPGGWTTLPRYCCWSSGKLYRVTESTLEWTSRCQLATGYFLALSRFLLFLMGQG